MKLLIAFQLLLFSNLYSESAQPNILVIMTDDMGYSDLGCYGSEIETPNLDELAKNGIRYTQMYNASKCAQTRLSLLTGVYHQESNDAYSHTALVSEVLRPAGYQCWWVGKHHADFNPYDRGFHHFSGFLGGYINSWNPSGVSRKGEPDLLTEVQDKWVFDKKVVFPYHVEKDFYATDRFTDWALNWLSDSKNDPSPFFLYVAYNAPHWPLHAHEKDINKYEKVYMKGYEKIRKKRFEKQIEMGLFDPKVVTLSKLKQKNTWDNLSEDEKYKEAMRMAMHAAMVDNVDQNIGRLIQKLKDQNRFENTLILFLVDNGASPLAKNLPSDEKWGSVGTFQSIGPHWASVANTPLRYWKVTSYEGGINTPMIAHWPEGISKPNSIYRQAGHVIDLMPTWIEIAGRQATYPGISKQKNILPLQGISIAPSFHGEDFKRKSPLYFDLFRGKAIRTDDWKLVSHREKGWELYHLKNDRTENYNLAENEPELVKTMATQHELWKKSVNERRKSH